MVIGNVILRQRWRRLIMRDVVVRLRRRVGVDTMLHLFEQRLLPLFLLAKDVDVVL
jgi:hypothetical protein